jgi:hypothetical protein
VKPTVWSGGHHVQLRLGVLELSELLDQRGRRLLAQRE